MKAEYWDNKLIAYLDGTLSKEESNSVEQAVVQSEDLQKQLAQFQQLFQGIEQLEEQNPSEQLDQGFYQFLEKEQVKESRVHSLKPITEQRQNYRWIWTSAAAIVFLISGLLIGWQLSNQSNKESFTALKEEIQLTKTMMFELLQKESTSSRIKALNISHDFAQADDEIVDVLIHTLKHDKSVNVKLAAIEALAHFSNIKKIRSALVSALGLQKNPVVQIELITVLVAIKEQQALHQMQALIEQEETADKVKDEARLGQIKLQSI